MCSFSGRGGGCLEVLGGSGGEICTKKKDIDQNIAIYIYIYVGTAIQALVVERCRTSLQDRLKMEWLEWRRE